MLMCILPLATVLFFNLYTLRHAQEQGVHQEVYRLGQVASLEMARIVGGAEDTLLAVAAAPPVRDFDQAACNDYMARVVRSLPQFSGIAVLDAQGIVRCLQQPEGIGVSLADRDYFKKSLASGQTVLGRYTSGRISHAPVLPVAVPIRDNAGVITGVVAGSMSLGWLEKRLTERQFARNGSLTVADGDGTVIARYPQPEKFVGTVIPAQFKHLVTAVAPGTIELTSQDGTRRILAYFPAADLSKGLYVSVGLSTDEEYRAIRSAMIRGLVVTLLAIGVASLLAWLIGRYSIRRPVERLVSTVEAWRSGDPDARTGLEAKDGEFGVVGKAIDAFMGELVEARGRSEFLMRELDHRVKNLLATVQVIIRQTLRTAEVDPAVQKTLNARLSAMSEAHSVLTRDETRTASFTALVAAALDPFHGETANPFHVAGPDFTVGSSSALAFTMALHELATNAVKYGSLSADGTVEVTWRIGDGAEGETLYFRWAERGGPPATPPATSGFGSVMIRRMLADQLHGVLDIAFSAEGLTLTFDVPTARLVN
jgi:two-component sensor histidine kinase